MIDILSSQREHTFNKLDSAFSQFWLKACINKYPHVRSQLPNHDRQQAILSYACKNSYAPIALFNEVTSMHIEYQ